MKTLLLLLTVTISWISFGQLSTTFRINYDQALLDLPGNAVESLTPNQYVFAGTNTSFFPIYGTVTELDANGDLVWSKSYSDGSFGFQINDIKKDQSSNEYYICGGSESNAGVFMRIDALGNVVASTRFEIAEADGAFLNRIIKTSDGGYVAVGYVTGHDPDGTGPEIEFSPVNYTNGDGDPDTEVIGSPLIVKFDAIGNHLWHHVTRYYGGAVSPANAIYNDASFRDVVETADGYIAVGQYDVADHPPTTSGDNDATPTDALIFKTNPSGAIQYHRQVDNPNTSISQGSKFLSAINKTNVGDPIAGGGDDLEELIMKFGATGGFSLTFSRNFEYSGNFLTGADPVDVSQIYEVNGSTDIVTMAMYIPIIGFLPEFNNSLHRMNATATSSIWAKKYNFGLATILPRGQQTSDGGYIMTSTTFGPGSFDYEVIKTDQNGDTPLLDCPPGTFSPSGSGGPTTIGTPNANEFSGTPGPNGLAVASANITPTQNVICRTIECTPPPIATTVTATPATICAGQSSSITASGPGTNVIYNVYDAATGGTNLGATPLSVSPGTTTTYYVETVDNSDPLCVSVSRVPVTVTVNPIPTANPSSNSPLCVGDNLNLTTDNVSGATYSWTGPNGFTSSSEDPTINSVTLAADGTYSLTVTAAGCSNGPVTTDVVVNNTPSATAGAVSTTVCDGDNIELTGNTVTGGTYSWTGPNGFTSSDQNPTIVGAGTNADGTYSLTISIGSCTSNTATVDITVNPAPTVSAGATATTVCEGDDIELNSTAVPGGSYSWTGPNGFTSGNQNPTINNATTAADGIYSLTVTVSGCASTASTVGVTVNPAPIATPGAVSTTICSGDDIELTSNLVSGATYSWTGPNGFTSSDQNPTINGAGVNADGTYSLTITVGSCSSSTETVDITVNETPTITANAVSTDVCEGDDIELTAGTLTGATYSWTGPNGFTSADQNPIITGTTSAEDGTYTLIVTANGCSSASSDVTVTVNLPASLTVVGTDISCNGLTDGEATVTPIGTGPYSFSWSPGSATSQTATGLTDGTYTVEVTDGNGCISSETVTITQPTAIALTTSATASQCSVDDGTGTVTATGGEGTYTYDWTPSSQTTATATGIGAGIYDVEVTDGNGCSETASVTVPSLNGPALSVVDQQNVSCFGANDGSAEIEATGGTPNYTYDWSPNGGSAPLATGLSPGTYTVEVTDDGGCTAIETIEITEPNAIQVTEIIGDTDCGTNNGSISVTPSGGTPSYSYEWTPNAGNTASISNLGAGTYALTITDDNGCEVTSNYTVFASGVLPVDITPPTATIDAGESVDLDVIIGAGVTGENYSWSPSNGLSCVNCPNPIASPDSTTTYYVTVTTADGCSSTDSVVIFVDQPCPELFVPTVFSPNGDGNNDMYCIYGGCIDVFTLEIYNRWGELIFTTNDLEQCWDGTQKGDPVNTGTYVFKLNLTKTDGEVIQQTGNVNVVR